MTKLKILWDPTTKANLFADGEVVAAVDEILEAIKHPMFEDGSKDGMTIVVGQATLINEFRLRIAKGQLDNEAVELHINDLVIIPYKNGKLSDWPEGFCDLQTDQLEAIMCPTIKDLRRTCGK